MLIRLSGYSNLGIGVWLFVSVLVQQWMGDMSKVYLTLGPKSAASASPWPAKDKQYRKGMNVTQVLFGLVKV